MCPKPGRSSNLGQATVAIHWVFDTRQDRLVFDVGHQCYCHKILTGRREAMATLRQYGGIAGFPKLAGSCSTVAGHASNSVAVALGMVRPGRHWGSTIKSWPSSATGPSPVVWPMRGCPTPGPAASKLLVILNDNGMSITPNAAVADHLAKTAP